VGKGQVPGAAARSLAPNLLTREVLGQSSSVPDPSVLGQVLAPVLTDFKSLVLQTDS
jgi:hypothetical protein